MTKEEERIYVGCFSFDRDDAEDDVGEERGTFEIVVEAADRNDALKRLRAKLDEVAESSDPLGPILVFLNALVQIPKNALGLGVLVNHVSMDREGSSAEDAL